MNESRPTRQLHIPSTISAEAQAHIWSLEDQSSRIPRFPTPDDLAAWRKIYEEFELLLRPANDEVVQSYEPDILEVELAGVPALDIRPKGWIDDGTVMMHLHGGTYTLFSAASTLTGTIPLAHDLMKRVVSVDYTVAPKARQPEILEQCLTAFGGLVKSNGLANIVVSGHSAGGGLAAGMVLKMRDAGTGMPAAVVLLSPWSDLTENGDTYETLKEAEPCYTFAEHLGPSASAYVHPGDQHDPYVSPVYGNYRKGFPPTLIQGGTKEIFLSNFVRHYQALDQAGIGVKLDLYEGMFHDFMANAPTLPESRLARQKIKQFVDHHLPKR